MSDVNSRNTAETPNGDGKNKGRSSAERITLAISIFIVLALAGLVLLQFLTEGTRPPVIAVEPKLGEIRQEGDSYYLPIDVTNRGEVTAEGVEVELTLTPEEGEPESVGFTVDFLAGDETHYQTAVFKSNPSEGELSPVVSYTTP